MIDDKAIPYPRRISGHYPDRRRFILLAMTAGEEQRFLEINGGVTIDSRESLAEFRARTANFERRRDAEDTPNRVDGVKASTE